MNWQNPKRAKALTRTSGDQLREQHRPGKFTAQRTARYPDHDDPHPKRETLPRDQSRCRRQSIRPGDGQGDDRRDGASRRRRVKRRLVSSTRVPLSTPMPDLSSANCSQRLLSNHLTHFAHQDTTNRLLQFLRRHGGRRLGQVLPLQRQDASLAHGRRAPAPDVHLGRVPVHRLARGRETFGLFPSLRRHQGRADSPPQVACGHLRPRGRALQQRESGTDADGVGDEVSGGEEGSCTQGDEVG